MAAIYDQVKEPASAAPPPTHTEQISPFTPNPPTAARPTLPESPATIAIQLQQLGQGVRSTVMIPKGTPPPNYSALPMGVSVASDPYGNQYLFRRDMTTRSHIESAAKNNKLNEVLGHAQMGLGAPDKSELPPNPHVVVVRAADGTEVQSTATSEEHLPRTISAMEALKPLGGTVSMENAPMALAQRQAPETENSGEYLRGDWNIPLNQTGQAQADAMAQKNAGQFNRIVSGTKDRHRETAARLAATNPQSAPPEASRDFDPMHLGVHEGELATPQRIEEINQHVMNRFAEPLPGVGKFSGSPGESPAIWSGRLLNGLSREIQNWQPGTKTAIITSGRDIQALRALEASGYNGIDKNVLTAKWRTNPGEMVHLDPQTGQLTDIDSAQAPGIYLARHGETDANSNSAVPRDIMMQRYRRPNDKGRTDNSRMARKK